jgi:hypothetical protein
MLFIQMTNVNANQISHHKKAVLEFKAGVSSFTLKAEYHFKLNQARPPLQSTSDGS